MSILLSDDHQMLVEAVRQFARSELIERDRTWDRTEGSCCGELGPLYDLGLLALRVPEEFGGLGCPMVPYAHIIRELAACSASVAVTVSVHNMVAEIIHRFADPEVQRELLPRLGQPGNLAAFAVSEANAGSDPSSVRMRAEPCENGYRLTGSKLWVTNGMCGKWFVMLARVVPAPDDGGARRCERDNLAMFLLDAEQEGVQRSRISGKMGIRGSETAEMVLDAVFIPAQRLLGRVGEGLNVALSALDGGRIGIASQAAGIAQACLELMIGYARQREQFGQPIAGFQAIQTMIADSQVELMASRVLIDRAAWQMDQGRPCTQAASMAKLYASEAANRIAYRAVQVHGGYGYVNETRVEQLYRDARVTTIYEGTSEVQRIVISRGLLDA